MDAVECAHFRFVIASYEFTAGLRAVASSNCFEFIYQLVDCFPDVEA